MELDMHAIRRLSPRGLWSLAPIQALIGTLLAVIKSGSVGHYSPLYRRMLVEQQMRLREKIFENLNMRIKAWVMQCPERIAWVRSIIGEAAIKHWRKNRLADYALRKYFGDWKRKFPNGFKNDGFGNKEQAKRQMRKPGFVHTARPYIWKPFALIKIINVSRFLYGRPAPKTNTASAQHWTQPREKHTLKPVRFTPSELLVEAATGTEGINTQNKTMQLDVENTVITNQRAQPLPCTASPIISAPTDPPLDTKPP